MKVYAIFLKSSGWNNDVLQEIYASEELAQSKVSLYVKELQDKLYIEEIEVFNTLNPDL